MKKYIFIWGYLLFFPLLSFAQPVGTTYALEPLEPGSILKVDLETDKEISQWLQEAREIDPTYQLNLWDKSGDSKGNTGKVKQKSSCPHWGLSYAYTSGKYDGGGWFNKTPAKGYEFSVMYALLPWLDIGLTYGREKVDRVVIETSVSDDWYYSTTWKEKSVKNTTEKVLVSGRIHARDSFLYIPFGFGLETLKQQRVEYHRNDYGQGYQYFDEHDDDNGLLYYLGLGIDIPLSKAFSVGAEGRYQWLQLALEETDYTIKSFTFTLGATLRF